ncbi:MAG TPA: cupin domain-containing protein [Thermomicrobiaceae bacterium]|nr:cupin domain-containing protein [Thermomicrobiaceae bacterium]
MPHLHHDDEEAWYVLEGTLRFRTGEREFDAPAGSAVLGPRGVAHTFWNPSREPARYLLAMTGNTWGMIQELHAGGANDPEALRAIYRRHGCQLLD